MLSQWQPQAAIPAIDDPFDSTLARFLGAFERLEELFLGLKGPTHSLDTLTNASRHQKTLRRLVLHQRGTESSAKNNQFQYLRDVPSMPVDPDVPDDVQNDPSRNPLVGLNLYSIGLGYASEIMSGLDRTHTHVESDAMDPAARRSRSRCEVSVIGQLRDHFFNFAMGLFGPQGIPSVEALAFGDFAYGFAYNGLWLGLNFVL
ncbi:hypothetical protein TOPH_07960 [Tolypocladium ophioglossoides CBS 100239]|uniref:Uncharacterized protein n=1 Tax=Tolypocladium ophioglossoides (strain CBS 100239) TaxID=1163406 RepID=A0A0L0MZL8_TOLOC|nr:hypothetical protein TOPH_07960 [Tolypocladium ophioglossoides CBS 100239]